MVAGWEDNGVRLSEVARVQPSAFNWADAGAYNSRGRSVRIYLLVQMFGKPYRSVVGRKKERTHAKTVGSRLASRSNVDRRNEMRRETAASGTAQDVVARGLRTSQNGGGVSPARSRFQAGFMADMIHGCAWLARRTRERETGQTTRRQWMLWYKRALQSCAGLHSNTVTLRYTGQDTVQSWLHSIPKSRPRRKGRKHGLVHSVFTGAAPPNALGWSGPALASTPR